MEEWIEWRDAAVCLLYKIYCSSSRYLRTVKLSLELVKHDTEAEGDAVGDHVDEEGGSHHNPAVAAVRGGVAIRALKGKFTNLNKKNLLKFGREDINIIFTLFWFLELMLTMMKILSRLFFFKNLPMELLLALETERVDASDTFLRRLSFLRPGEPRRMNPPID